MYKVYRISGEDRFLVATTHSWERANFIAEAVLQVLKLYRGGTNSIEIEAEKEACNGQAYD